VVATILLLEPLEEQLTLTPEAAAARVAALLRPEAQQPCPGQAERRMQLRNRALAAAAAAPGAFSLTEGPLLGPQAEPVRRAAAEAEAEGHRKMDLTPAQAATAAQATHASTLGEVTT
jgi:hypothetical protein